MAYTTPEKVRNIVRHLPPNRISDEEIKHYIARAEAYIDGALSEVYALPFKTVPKLIQVVATDLAVFFLMESLYSSNSPNLDEYQEKRYERAMETLSDIANSRISLPGAIKLMDRREKYGSTTAGMDPIFTYEEPEW
jgi:phage gp36-like protein